MRAAGPAAHQHLVNSSPAGAGGAAPAPAAARVLLAPSVRAGTSGSSSSSSSRWSSSSSSSRAACRAARRAVDRWVGGAVWRTNTGCSHPSRHSRRLDAARSRTPHTHPPAHRHAPRHPPQERVLRGPVRWHPGAGVRGQGAAGQGHVPAGGERKERGAGGGEVPGVAASQWGGNGWGPAGVGVDKGRCAWEPAASPAPACGPSLRWLPLPHWQQHQEPTRGAPSPSSRPHQHCVCMRACDPHTHAYTDTHTLARRPCAAWTSSSASWRPRP